MAANPRCKNCPHPQSFHQAKKRPGRNAGKRPVCAALACKCPKWEPVEEAAASA